MKYNLESAYADLVQNCKDGKGLLSGKLNIFNIFT